MPLPSSSTSSSDSAATAAAPTSAKRKTWLTLVAALLWLAVIDVLVNIAFAFPADVRDTSPGKMALFFDYGRSMEGRLRRMTRPDRDLTAPITLAGWYDPLVVTERPAKPDGRIISIYGMSHAVRLAEAIQRGPSRYSVRSIGAPGAAANWAYGAFRRDTGRRKGDVAVLAIMSSTLPMITAVSPVTWNESFPLPYTADRYELRNGILQTISPPYDSFSGYVAALNDPAKWAATKAFLSRHDPYYDPLLFDASPLDRSTLVRMARRAWFTARNRDATGSVISAEGFDADSEAVQVANALVGQFAADARKDGLVPVIYIVNNLGFGDQLYQALATRLKADAIPYVSSHDFVDPRDPANYLPDTHFTDANDDKLARAIEEVIARSSMDKPRQGSERVPGEK